MIDPAITQQVSQTATKSNIDKAIQAVDGQDIDKFQQAMQQRNTAQDQTQTFDIKNAIITPCQSDSAQPCLGDKILDSMGKLKSNHDTQVEAINQSLEVDVITTQEIFSLQLDLAKLQIQEEMMAKTASKSTQNVDTLLKAQ